MAGCEGLVHYEVMLSEPAEEDVNERFFYYLLLSPNTAPRWRREVLEELDSLGQLPHRFPFAPHGFQIKQGTRQMIFRFGSSAYRVLYTIIEPSNGNPGVVSVSRVWHTSRGPLIESDTDDSED